MARITGVLDVLCSIYRFQRDSENTWWQMAAWMSCAEIKLLTCLSTKGSRQNNHFTDFTKLKIFSRRWLSLCWTSSVCSCPRSENEARIFGCLARALGAHLFGGLQLCGANKHRPLCNRLPHLNPRSRRCCCVLKDSKGTLDWPRRSLDTFSVNLLDVWFLLCFSERRELASPQDTEWCNITWRAAAHKKQRFSQAKQQLKDWWRRTNTQN